MSPSAKGKEKVIYSKESAKRKRVIPEDNDGSGKRRNRAVLQFIEDAAYQVDDDESSDDDSMFDEDFEEEEFDVQVQAPFEPVKPDPRTPKQEQMSEEDYDRMMEKRYKPGSGFVAYEEDKYEPKYSVDESSYPPPATGAIIWKVKCTVGRERHSAFCLMQKYLDLKYLGTKLHVLSAFVLDHVKGFIYIEAEKQSYIYEACNGICSIYSTRAMLVPKDDISLLFSARSKGSGISEGMWARVKNGKYRGDLAQVMAVNDERKKVTVKLIPRIDLRALADKFGRGDRVDRNVTPVPRLISTSELEEFRPLIQIRRDRDTNKVFEVLDGMMFKDGYLYKKMSADSLSLWGVTPTEDELLKFEPAKVDEHNDDEWLTQLYGEKKKKRRPIISGKGGGKGGGGGKGEGSSTNLESNFEVHDLVFFWRKDFGVIIATEKEATFKIIKDNSDGPITLTVTQNELRSADFDKKLFTALDQHGNKISINDTVKVVDGPLKEREGVVKRIYKGIVFVYNETSEENNGYICFKAQMCEKLESGVGLFSEKGGGPVVSSFGDQSSPKSPLSPQITQQEDRGHKFDDDAMYSIGQSLRIRVGPLKGYLCRVLAIRRSDVTVKLDSKHKIITVKSEHLSEVRGRSAGMSLGVDSDPAKPFEPKEQDGSGDWAAGTTTTAEGGNWNTGGLSTERSSWAPGNSSAQGESSKPPEDGTNKDDSWAAAKPVPAGGSSWGAAASTPAGGTSWGAAAATPAGGSSWGTTPAAAATPAGGSSWGAAPAAAATPAGGSSWSAAPVAAATPAGGSSWGAAPAAAATPAGGSSWGAAPAAAATPAGGSSVPASGSSWGAAPAAEGTTSQSEQVSGWGTPKSSTQPEANNWNKAKTAEQGNNSWGSVKKTDESTKPWGKADKESTDGGSALSDKFEGTSNKADTSSWGDKSANKKTEGGGGNIWNSKKSSEGGSSSVWGQNKGTETSNLNSQNDSSCKTDGGDWNSKKSAGVEGDAGAWGISKSSAGGSSSGWGTDKKSEAGNQDSWGQKSSFKPDNNFGGNEGGSNGGWSSKKTVDGGSSVGWGKNKSDGPNDAGANQGSWGSKSIVEGGSSSGWGKGATEGGGNGGSSTGWGQSKRGGAADGGGETWSKKSTWNSDSDNNLGGNEDDTGRGGGNWRGGRGGRWGSDRGGRFGGGRSDSDRGGFGGGRGRSDRGGFGGRGDSDRGGFRGRGGDRGGGFRGGRDGSDRGGFRGRGGFGDRGRGRREGGWSNQNDSGEDNKPYSRSSTADKGTSWSSGNGGGGSWSEKQSDNKGKWQSGGDGGNSQAGGWNRGSGSSQDGGADAKPSSWKNASEGGNVSGWASNNTSGGSWNSGDKGKNAAQGSGSDWNQSKGASNVGGGAAGSGSGSGAASWGKPPSSSWSKPGGESGKGGW